MSPGNVVGESSRAYDAQGQRRRRVPGATIAGGLMSAVGAFWIVVARAQLGTVLLTRVDVVSDTVAPTPSWAVMTAVMAAGLLLLSGPAVSGRRIDRVQLLGAIWTLLCAGFFDVMSYGVELTGPSTGCVYASCWPGRYQDLAVAAPMLGACLSMLPLAFGAGRLTRRSRALVPAIVFGALAVLQLAFWNSVVLPVLSGPPPF